MIISSDWRRLPLTLGVLAIIGGAIVAVYYDRLGLTLTHYDARGHLVVARRIFDSVTPGWQQIGAVWLPLPHLLNAIPVQVDAWYRSGASAVVISVVAFALAVASIGHIVRTLTGSAAAAVAGALVFALNPNVLYLQATPMTEPLLLGLLTLGTALLLDHASSTDIRRLRLSGLALSLACLTRYEAWPVTVCALATMAWSRYRGGEGVTSAVRHAGWVALYPALAVAGFAVFSRVVVGEWLTTAGFFVPENRALGDPALAAAEVWWGASALSGPTLLVVALAGSGWILFTSVWRREQAASLVVLSLAASVAVAWVAFVDGHPFRVRYMVPLLAIQGVAAASATMWLGRWRTMGVILLLALVAFDLRPLDRKASMVIEAQWDAPNLPARRRVTACVMERWRPGDKIMASMGSLGHYMQSASQGGLRLGDFLHEGNGDIWLAALEDPRPFAEWVLIEEKAEGGDVLARRLDERPTYLSGYSRSCEAAGLVLYRRN